MTDAPLPEPPLEDEAVLLTEPADGVPPVVETAEQLVGLVEGAVDVDVALDAGEDPEGCELLV